MVGRFPPILGYTIDAVLKPKLDFLVEKMGRSVDEVVAYPRFFSYSLEKKIAPRARVIANRGISCDLQSMLAKNNDQFAYEFLGVGRLLIPPWGLSKWKNLQNLWSPLYVFDKRQNTIFVASLMRIKCSGWTNTLEVFVFLTYLWWPEPHGWGRKVWINPMLYSVQINEKCELIFNHFSKSIQSHGKGIWEIVTKSSCM